MPGGRRAGSGRKPTPLSLRILRGNPGKRSIPSGAITPPAYRGDCPAWLDEPGREFWRDHAASFTTLGLLTTLSVSAFALLCDAWSTYRRAGEALNGELTHETLNNGLSARPELAIRKAAFDQFRVLAAEFGIGPASLMRLHVTGSNADRDPVDAHQKAPRRSA